jgi:hypothetical protein
MIQSRDGDWIINSHPAPQAGFRGIDSDSVSWQSDRKTFVSGYARGLFVWRPLTVKQKNPSRRPRRLCGEIPILDRNDFLTG